MLVKVQKWGNSLALRIPKAFASQLKIESGSVIDLSLEKGRLVIVPNENRANSPPLPMVHRNRHFQLLKEIEFPKVRVLGMEGLEKINSLANSRTILK